MPKSCTGRLLGLLVVCSALLSIVDVIHESHLETTGQSAACDGALCRTARLWDVLSAHASGGYVAGAAAVFRGAIPKK